MISFNGAGNEVLTFKAQTVTAGWPVLMAENRTVSNCAAGKEFIGVAANVRNDCAGVQTGGYVELPYTGTAPALGYGYLTADGTGGVKTAASGSRMYKIYCVDAEKSIVGFVL